MSNVKVQDMVLDMGNVSGKVNFWMVDLWGKMKIWDDGSS